MHGVPPPRRGERSYWCVGWTNRKPSGKERRVSALLHTYRASPSFFFHYLDPAGASYPPTVSRVTHPDSSLCRDNEECELDALDEYIRLSSPLITGSYRAPPLLVNVGARCREAIRSRVFSPLRSAVAQWSLPLLQVIGCLPMWHNKNHIEPLGMWRHLQQI